MNIFIVWEAHQIEGLVTSALMADNMAELRHISQDLERASNDLTQWALQAGGSLVLNLTSRGCVSIAPDRAPEVAMVRAKFQEASNTAMVVGMGMSIAEAFTALRHGKLHGSDGVSLYMPEMEEELINQPPGELFGKSEGLRKDGEPDDTPAPADPGSAPSPDSGAAGAGMMQSPADFQDPKQAIMQALQEIKANSGAIERLKSTSPAAYAAVKDVVQAMIMMAQNMAKAEDDEPHYSELDPEEVRLGIDEEMKEHGVTEAMAAKLVLDHLDKDPKYYSKEKVKKDEMQAMPPPATTPKKFNDQHPVGTQIDPPDSQGSQTVARIKTQGVDPQSGQPQPPKNSMVSAGKVMGPTGRAVSSREPTQE